MRNNLFASIEELERRITPALLFFEFIDPNPGAGNQFGARVLALSTGNVVITSPFDDAGGTDAGAVYLFNGATGALISALIGSHRNDQLGASIGPEFNSAEPICELSNGNFVVISPAWDNGSIIDAGAVTFGSGSTGVNGIVSAANSLVGSSENDRIGNLGVTALSNGNYVVTSSNWDNATAADAGAVTFANGTTGISGVVSAANSLVGSTTGDRIGCCGRAGDGFSSVIALGNGNYVVTSLYWDNGEVVDAGAATFGNGATGISGAISAANSLVGTSLNAQVGYTGATVLANDNYVVSSQGAAAVTLGSGVTGVSGTISAENSLIGAVGHSVFALSNGNYVVCMPEGAVTFGNGVTGVVGTVSAANSLVGTRFGTSVTLLSNGNYVISSPHWNNGALGNVGAVTFGDGTIGVHGTISVANSLIGSRSLDTIGIGFGGVVALSNGNYVVSSPYWDNGPAVDAGAVTFGNGTTGISGIISAANSLVGTTPNDLVGWTSGTVKALSNGNYVVTSRFWDNGTAVDAGAVTFGNGDTGISGPVSAANSLVGTQTNDQVGSFFATSLSNDNYIVGSPSWDNSTIIDAGAATFGNGATGISGAVSPANSLVGSAAGDQLGWDVTVLSNGNYVVNSPFWDNGAIVDAGASTFGNGTSGITGTVSPDNSLVGSSMGDQVGFLALALRNGNYVVASPDWDTGAAVDAGAATFGNGTIGVTGPVSAARSLVGTTTNDRVGDYFGIAAFDNGNYAVTSPNWHNVALGNSGAVTFGNGTTGISGAIIPSNSVFGLTADTGLQTFAVVDNSNNTFFDRFLSEVGGKVRVGSQDDGFTYTTTTNLVASPQATTGGQLVTFIETVGPSPGNLGTVTFRDNGLVIAADVPVVSGVATFQTATLTVGSHPIRADYSGGGGFRPSTSNTLNFTVSAPLPRVVSVTPNGNIAGFAGPQRSRVASLVVAFDQAVELDADAMTIALHTNNVTFNGSAEPAGVGVVPDSLDLATTDHVTWVVTFAGGTDPAADGLQSIKDGVYDLNVNPALIHPFGVPGVNGAAAIPFVFHRLFGDATGEELPVIGNEHVAVVVTDDNLNFRSAFNNQATYKSYFDFDGDGIVATADNFQFRSRFNRSLTWSA